MGYYDMINSFPGSAANAVTAYLAGWSAVPMVMPIDPWYRPGDLTLVIPNAKIKTVIPIPIHKAGLEKWKGSFVFNEQSNLFAEVLRETWTIGAKANTRMLAEMDFGAWSMSSSTMSVELGNNAGRQLVTLLNAARTSDDQVYKGTKIATLASDTPLKPVNPEDTALGSGWYNAHENFDITPENVITALENMQQRRAMNNVELNLGDEGVEIWVPFMKKERTRILFEVMRELAGTGVFGAVKVDYQVDTGGSPQTNQQVIYGGQSNPVYGRARVRAVHGMRSDLWMPVSPRPSVAEAGHLFIHSHGGTAGSYGIQTDPNAVIAPQVPHIATYVFDQNSGMFIGVPGVSSALDIGIANLLNEGFAWMSGLCAEFCYTGAAS